MDTQSAEQAKYIALTLQKTFTLPNAAEIRKTEEELRGIALQTPNFLELIAYILTDAQFADPIKQSAAVYIKTFIKAKINSDYYTKEEKIMHSKSIFAILSLPISNKIKNVVVDPFSSLMDVDYDHQLKNSIYADMVQKLQADSRENIYGGLYTIQAILSSAANQEDLVKFYKEINNVFIQTGAKITALVAGNLAGLAENQEILGETKLNLEMLNCWATTMKFFCNKVYDTRCDSFMMIIKDDTLAKLLSQIIFLNILSPLQIPNTLISTTAVSELDDTLNDCKFKAISCFNKVIAYINDSKRYAPFLSTEFYKSFPRFCKSSIDSLSSFCASEQYNHDSIAENKPIEGLVVELLEMIANFAQISDLYDLLLANIKPLVIEVGMPLMRSSKSEVDMFYDQPDDFVTLALDTCDKQLSEITKTAAAKMIENICDHIDGALSFVCFIAFEIINDTIATSLSPETPISPQLLEYSKGKFLMSPPDIKVETCLMIVSVLSYIIPKRNDLLQLLQKTLIQNSNFFLNQSASALVRARLCLILGYYSENLFVNQNPLPHLKFLVECISLNNNEEKAISLQAIDSLSNIIEDEDLVMSIKPIIFDLFGVLLELMPIIQHAEFFNILQSLSKHHAETIGKKKEWIVNYVKSLVNRIIIENKAGEGQDSKHRDNIVIIKCVNMLIETVKVSNYSLSNIDEIEHEILPVLAFIKTPERFGYKDELFNIISLLIKQRRGLSANLKQIFIEFTNIFEAGELVLGPIFECLNHYIFYGSEAIREDPRMLEILITMGTEALCAKTKQSCEVTNFEGALLLQLIIQTFYPVLNSDSYVKIYSKTFERCSRDIKNVFLKSGILEVFLSGLACSFELSKGILTQGGQMDQVVNLMVTMADSLPYMYNKKVYTIYLSNMLSNESQPQEVASKFGIIFEQLVSVLKTLHKDESAKESRKMFENLSDSDDDMDDDFKDDDFDSDDDKDFNFDKENDDYQAQRLVENLLTSIKKLDEFEVFRTSVAALKERNQAALQGIVATMPEKKQTYLRQILFSKRIEINEQTSVARKIVKVRAKKRPGQN